MSESTVTLIAAMGFSVVGIGTFFHFFVMVIRWPKATGAVVGNVTQLRSTDGNEYAHFALIEFRAADGKTYEVRGDIGRTQDWPLGDTVTLRYRALNPNHTTILNSWQRLLFSAVFIGFGVACWYAWLG